MQGLPRSRYADVSVWPLTLQHEALTFGVTVDIWQRVQLLQVAVVIAAMVFGTLFLRMRLWQAGLATVLALPAPLMQVAGGAGSWVFPADALVPILIVAALIGLLPPVDEQSRRDNRTLLLLALLVLVVVPALSTLLGFFINPQPRLLKFMALPLVRSVGFYVVFRMFVLRFRNLPVQQFLLLQCLVLTAIFALGLAQYSLRIDLDLWRAVQPRTNPDGVRLIEYGGGFMGLYRGAVGAWAAGILAVMPLVMANRAGWNIVFPLSALTILGGVLAVGSRQGLAIGVVALVIGLVMAGRAFGGGRTLRVLGNVTIALLLLAPLVVIAWSRVADEKLGLYVLRRFEVVFDLARLLEEAANRDPRIWLALKNVFSDPYVFLLGIGYGVEYLVAVPGGHIMVFVDSEIFSVWQVGGTLLLSLYIWFLVLMRTRLRRWNWPEDDHGRIAAAAGIVVFYAGLMLMWGHFSLMTPYANQAPVAYWQWSILGLAAASCVSAHRYGEEYALMAPEFHDEYATVGDR